MLQRSEGGTCIYNMQKGVTIVELGRGEILAREKFWRQKSWCKDFYHVRINSSNTVAPDKRHVSNNTSPPDFVQRNKYHEENSARHDGAAATD